MKLPGANNKSSLSNINLAFNEFGFGLSKLLNIKLSFPKFIINVFFCSSNLTIKSNQKLTNLKLVSLNIALGNNNLTNFILKYVLFSSTLFNSSIKFLKLFKF